MAKTADLELKVLDGEFWYGGVVATSTNAPYGSRNYEETMVGNFYGNQACPFLVSTSGRYIWSEEPFNFQVKDRILYIQDACGDLVFDEGSATLKEAYLKAAAKYFPASGTYPDELNFSAPQANSWIELNWHPSQEKVMSYARKVLESGLEPGVMMIDNYWYKWNGNWRFDLEAFPDPKGMIKELHEMGFKVILWVSPFITADSRSYKILRNKDYLIKDSEGNPAIQQWWDGHSACIDLTNPAAVKWEQDQLDELVDDYGVDGFKFDGGDAFRYKFSDITHEKITPNGHCETFGRLGLKYGTSEFRACWKLGGQALIQRTRDKAHSWGIGGLADLIPSAFAQGLIGYPYNCPDMIGGGEMGSFTQDDFRFDQELYVRWMQCSVFFPIIQFSSLPANCLDKEKQEMVARMISLRKEITPYIIEQVKETAKSGEPILRPLDYNYPGQGYADLMDQFMIGERYLVAPVLEKGAVSRKVKFPAGKWQAENGKVIEGPCELDIAAPLDVLPWYKWVE